MLKEVVGGGFGLKGLAAKRHLRLLYSLATLVMITRAAGTHEVFPDMPPTPMFRHDMVERQLFAPDAAILACVLVAEEYLTAREPDSRSRALDEMIEPDNRWDADRAGRGMIRDAVDVEHLGLAPIDQDDSAPCITHVQRLIVLI